MRVIVLKKLGFQNISKKVYLLVAVLLVAGLGGYVVAFRHGSGGASLTLTPGSSSVSMGTNFTVTITEDSGSHNVSSLEADLHYDSSMLQFVDIDSSTGAFSQVAQSRADSSSGTVYFAAGAASPVNGRQTVAKVTFMTIGQGSTNIAFANSSGIADATTNSDILGTTSGGVFNISDTTAPTAPTGLSARSRTATSVKLSWNASDDNVGVVGYRVYRGDTMVGTSPTNSYTDKGLSPNNSYSYTVVAFDAASNTSAPSPTLSTSTTTDLIAPSTPAGLRAGTRDLTSIQFSWTASTDNVGVVGYKVYRDGVQVGTVSSTSYTDSGLTPGKAYSYKVVAFDAAGNTSGQSTPLSSSTLADSTAPSAPTNLTTVNQTTNSISLSWTASTDNVAVAGYTIYRGGTKVGTTSGTTYTDTGLTSGASYTYSITAYDTSGNVSSSSTSKQATTTMVVGDVNGDGRVDYLDLSALAQSWQSKTDLRGDFNHDGVVNFLDLSIMAAHWSK